MPEEPRPHPTDTLWALALSVNAAVTDRLDRIATALADIRAEVTVWRSERASAAERGWWVKDVDGIHPLRREGETDSPDTL